MLPVLPKKKIEKILLERELEDLGVLKTVEKILLSKRGYVFKMPKPGTPVISLMSGGLDTTVVTAILMEEFKLRVYPVYFNREIEHSKMAIKATFFFSKIFSKAYPNLFHHPKVLSLTFPPKEISEIIFSTDSPETKIKKGSNQRRGIPFQPALYAYNSLLYTHYLKEIEKIKIRDIFGAWIPSNTDWYAYETLTSLREIMFDICSMTKDYSWQYTSLPMEKELGFFYDKDYFIRWAYERGIPLEKTRSSCRSRLPVHCGSCLLCSVRREAFKKAGVPDRTLYVNDLVGGAKDIYWNFGKKIVPKSLRRLLKKVIGIGRK